jgi:hypothetical protein
VNSSGNVVDAVGPFARLLYDTRVDMITIIFGLCYRILRFSACLPGFSCPHSFCPPPAIFLLLAFCDFFLAEIIPIDAKHVPMFYAFNPRTKHDIHC